LAKAAVTVDDKFTPAIERVQHHMDGMSTITSKVPSEAVTIDLAPMPANEAEAEALRPAEPTEQHTAPRTPKRHAKDTKAKERERGRRYRARKKQREATTNPNG
jgi:hypothetical protein